MPDLGSKWDGLSKHLIARFYAVKRKGSSRNWQPVPDGPVVCAPLTECTLDVSPQWQSPFEDAGNILPTIKAMMSSGAITQWVGGGDDSANKFSQFEGRTGVTKLNSTQVFNGMPPLKFSVVALFRAWDNAAFEVETPVEQLMKWALPEHLAEDGPLMSALESIKEAPPGKTLDEHAADIMLPSHAPVKIAMEYKGRSYFPLVIESIGLPLGSPIDSEGNFVELAVPMTICSLAAIDQADWERTRTSSGFTI